MGAKACLMEIGPLLGGATDLFSHQRREVAMKGEDGARGDKRAMGEGGWWEAESARGFCCF